MRLNKIPKSLYLGLIIGVIVIGSVIFIQKQSISQPQEMEKSVFESEIYNYTVEYPSSWYFHNSGKKMDTFYISNISPNQYHHGGILPAGGAEIFIKVASVSSSKQSLSEFITEELKHTIILSKENIQVDGIEAIKTIYLWEVGPGSFYKNVAVYFSVDKKIYKILLSFRKGDPKESYFMRVFDSVISSFCLTGRKLPAEEGS